MSESPCLICRRWKDIRSTKMPASRCCCVLLVVTILAELYSADAVSMYITPSSIVVDSSSASDVPRVELRCSSGGTSNISGVYNLEISRRRSTDTGYTRVAQLDGYEGSKLDPNIPADILAKSPNITGGLVGNPPTSGTLIVTMGVGGLTCNDQAEFKCEMTYKAAGTSGTAIASAHNYFTVSTAPKDVVITGAFYEEGGTQIRLTDDKALNVDTRITYRCTANIGSDPSVSILWEKSSSMGTCAEFITYTPTVSTDIVQVPVTQTNCSFSRTSSMYYNLKSCDDTGITFRCKVRAFLDGQWYESMSAHHRTYTVRAPTNTSSATTISSIIADGVSMYVTPSSIVVDSSSATAVSRLELRCSGGRTSNIAGDYSLEISRRRSTDTEYTRVAQLDGSKGSKLDPNIPADILAKTPNITGGLVGNPPTSGTLIVTMGVGGLTCIDQAEFKCEMTFKDAGASGTAIASAHNYFTVRTAPKDAQITDAFYEKDGSQIQMTNETGLNVGTIIMYRCTANIGSDPRVSILWEKSSSMGTSTEFITYTPTVSTDIVQDPVTQTNCSFSRTSSMYYSLTSLDATGITFRCKVRAFLDEEWYESMSAYRRIYTVLPPARTSSATTISSITGFAFGYNSMWAVMVVFLSLYQSIYRRCTDG